MTVIAIDFGTKYSSVAARLQNGWVYTLPDDHGKIRISSCVAFQEDGVRIGNLADLKRHTNVENTIIDIKSLLGLNFESANGLKEKYNWPFKVVNDGEQRPKLEVQYLGSTVSYYPEEILAIFLNHLVQIAENRLRPVQVSGAVITVPPSFNHLKRKAIDNAARIAGINLKALVNDTTAAAIYYSNIPQHVEKTMIIHIGAGSLAVSICHVTDNGITVKFTDGELSLGGRDINRTMISEMKPSREVTNLHKSIEEVKISFCQPTKMNCQIELEYRRGKKEMKTIPRQAYEQACCPIRDRLKFAINQSKEWCHHERVSKVILIGGSTRLPLVEQLLTDMNLNKRIETTGIKADEIVALGAGMLAAQYVELDLVKNHFAIKDVLTYSVLDVERNLLVSKNRLLSECQERAKQPSKCKEVLKIIEVAGNVAIISKTLSAEDLKSAIIITDNGLISVNRGKSKVADGLSENMINKLIWQQNQLSQGTVEREATEKEKYHLEKQTLGVKKEMKKISRKCDATGELIDKEPGLSLADVQRERKEFRDVFLRCVGNMKAIMGTEEEVSKTDDYVKKLETLYKSMNDELQSEKKRCQSLNIDLQTMRDRWAALQGKLQEEKEKKKHESAGYKSLKDELQSEKNRCQSLDNDLQRMRNYCQSMDDKLQAERERNERESTHYKSLNDELQSEKKRCQSLNIDLQRTRNHCISLQDKLQTEKEKNKNESAHYKFLNDELQSEKNRCQSLNSDLQGMRNRCQSLQDKLQAKRERHERESGYYTSMKEELQSEKIRCQSLASDLQAMGSRCQSLEDKLQAEIERNKVESTRNIKTMNEALQAEKKRNRSLQRELEAERYWRELQDKEQMNIEDMKRELIHKNSPDDELNAERSLCQSLKEQLESERNICESLKNKLQACEDEKKSESTQYKSLNEELQSKTMKCQSLNNDLQKMRSRCKSLQDKVREEKQKNKDASAHYKSLDDQLQTERSRSKSLNDDLQAEKNVSESLRHQLEEERRKKPGMSYSWGKPITHGRTSSQASIASEQRLLDETRESPNGEDSRNRDNKNTGSAPRRTLLNRISDGCRRLYGSFRGWFS